METNTDIHESPEAQEAMYAERYAAISGRIETITSGKGIEPHTHTQFIPVRGSLSSGDRFDRPQFKDKFYGPDGQEVAISYFPAAANEKHSVSPYGFLTIKQDNREVIVQMGKHGQSLSYKVEEQQENGQGPRKEVLHGYYGGAGRINFTGDEFDFFGEVNNALDLYEKATKDKPTQDNVESKPVPEATDLPANVVRLSDYRK